MNLFLSVYFSFGFFLFFSSYFSITVISISSTFYSSISSSFSSSAPSLHLYPSFSSPPSLLTRNEVTRGLVSADWCFVMTGFIITHLNASAAHLNFVVFAVLRRFAVPCRLCPAPWKRKNKYLVFYISFFFISSCFSSSLSISSIFTLLVTLHLSTSCPHFLFLSFLFSFVSCPPPLSSHSSYSSLFFSVMDVVCGGFKQRGQKNERGKETKHRLPCVGA